MTMILLIIHQIDAAYWQEWEMFLVPGGIQGFLVFNIVIIPIILLGYKSVIVNDNMACKYSYLCSGLAVFTFIAHLFFMLLNYSQFTLPLSILIIVSCLISGIYQIKQTLKFSKAV